MGKIMEIGILYKLTNEIDHLKEAKSLLNDILSHYNIYDQQFEKLDETKYPIRGPYANKKSEADELNIRIRSYLGFDDSE